MPLNTEKAQALAEIGMGLAIIGCMAAGHLCYYFAGMHPFVCVILFGIIAVISVAIIAASRWLSKTWMSFIGALWVGVLTVFFFNPVSLFILGYSASATGEERNMCNPKTYTVVGETLALYCQSYQLLRSYSTAHSDCVTLHGAWIPKGLRGVGTVRQNSASIGMGGVLYHHGYELSLDTQASSADTNVWQLYYSEGKNKSKTERHLLTIRMDASRRLTADELLSIIVANYDAFRWKDSSLVYHECNYAWGEKVQTYLLFDRVTEARSTCRELLARAPRKWNKWLMLTVALITAEEESFERAEQMMAQWVNEDENFESYFVLAYFYQLSDKPHKAAEAMRQTTKYGVGRNVGSENYTMAMYFYGLGKYDVVIQLCEHALSNPEGNYHEIKKGLSALYEAALNARQDPDEVKPVGWEKYTSPFNAYKGVDLERLLQRPVPKMTIKTKN